MPLEAQPANLQIFFAKMHRQNQGFHTTEYRGCQYKAHHLQRIDCIVSLAILRFGLRVRIHVSYFFNEGDLLYDSLGMNYRS